MLPGSLRNLGKNVCEKSAYRARHASTVTVTKQAGTRKTKKGSSQTSLEKADVKLLSRMSSELIKGTKSARKDMDWRYTNDKKGEQKRLSEEMLRRNNKDNKLGSKAASILTEEHTFELGTVDEILELQANEMLMQAGSFFEMRRSGITAYGVVIACVMDHAGHQHNTLSMNTDGELFFHRSTDAMFTIPNFVDADLVQRCGETITPGSDHEMQARLKVLRKARSFERALETESFRLGRVMNEVYEQVRAKSPESWGKVSSMQVARLVHPAANVPVVTLFAVHKQMMERLEEYVCHPFVHRYFHTFDVRPLSHVENFRRIRQWIRDRSPIIARFQQKAKAIIEESREIAAESRHEPPSVATSAASSATRFTPQELDIIKFLKLSLGQSRRIQGSLHESFVPSLIKDTDKSRTVWGGFDTLKFLQEIGVYTPWEEVVTKQKDVRISDLIMQSTTDSQSFEAVATKIDGLLANDPHESVRHDFGNMPVYVIDDVGAEELDDGISLEHIPGQHDQVWLHIHVADPTAVLSVDHPLVQGIEERTESLYFEHKSYPMLPKAITSLSDLGREDIQSTGQKALTFSAKIGSKGEIQDYKVRASIIRNLHRLQYDAVNEVIGTPTTQYKFRPFEPTYTPPVRDLTTATRHVKALKRLHEITRLLVQNRLRTDYASYNQNIPEVAFLDKPLLENPPVVTQPILYRGFPRLTYTVATYKHAETGARSMVAECMKVAGRVSSRFCLDHNLPVLRLHLPPAIYHSEEYRQRVLEERDELGFVEPTTILCGGVFLPPSESVFEPRGHVAVGAQEGEGYMRATSPLRRAEDMFNHWQLKSALLPGNGNRPPLSKDDFLRVMNKIATHKLAVKKAYRRYARFWSHEFIMRYMEEEKRAEKEGKTADFSPLRDLEGVVMTEQQYHTYQWTLYQDVYIPKLGIIAAMKSNASTTPGLAEKVKVNALQVMHSDMNPLLEVEHVL